MNKKTLTIEGIRGSQFKYKDQLLTVDGQHYHLPYWLHKYGDLREKSQPLSSSSDLKRPLLKFFDI